MDKMESIYLDTNAFYLFSIKDKKFLIAGVYFITLLPGVILGLFFLTLKLVSPKSSYLPEELRRN